MSRERVCVNQTCRQLICNLIRTVEEIVKKRDDDLPGPAPVDPGNSKGGRRWRGKTCLFINIRLD